MNEHVSLPDRYAHQRLTADPRSVVSGTPKEFLHPGSSLLHIQGGRKARMKDAEHTVYRKALYIRKDGFDTATREILGKGMIAVGIQLLLLKKVAIAHVT